MISDNTLRKRQLMPGSLEVKLDVELLKKLGNRGRIVVLFRLNNFDEPSRIVCRTRGFIGAAAATTIACPHWQRGSMGNGDIE